MRNTVYCSIPIGTNEAEVRDSIAAIAAEVKTYVPGYEVKGIVFDDGPYVVPGNVRTARVAVLLEVTGNGDYLPPYAGNLDIMTASAVRVAETVVASAIVSGLPA
jgi:acetaldehyde dehydrogenase